MIKKFIQTFWDIIFPPSCIICDKEGEYLCKDCINRVPVNIKDHFPIKYLDKLIVVSSLNHPIIQKAISRYKNYFIKDLSKPLAVITAKKLAQVKQLSQFTLIPIPEHSKQIRKAGFSCSKTLAKELKRSFKELQYLPDALTRESHNQFTVSCKSKLPNKVIIISDHISDSTIQKCAKALRKAGVKTVWGLVIARKSR